MVPPAPVLHPRIWEKLGTFRRTRRLLALLALVYFGFCGFLYLKQDQMIYPIGPAIPTAEATREAAAVGLVPWDHPTPGAVSPQGYVPENFSTASAPRGTIVVFHGNGGWAAQRSFYVEAFAQRGFRTFLYEYAGYGGRPGHPHERLIVPDARALVRELAREGWGPLYLWGESLGSGVAAEVAADATLPVRGLALMTPYDRIAGVALYRYPYVPVTLLLRDRYDTMANLAHFRRPVCVIRSSEDEIIPPALTLLLYQRLPGPKKMIVQPGVGHDDWPTDPALPWWNEALDFIAPR
jgi:pimeloyl-ACP methyl ester carboxylesterase